MLFLLRQCDYYCWYRRCCRLLYFHSWKMLTLVDNSRRACHRRSCSGCLQGPRSYSYISLVLKYLPAKHNHDCCSKLLMPHMHGKKYIVVRIYIIKGEGGLENLDITRQVLRWQPIFLFTGVYQLPSCIGVAAPTWHTEPKQNLECC